MDKKTGRIIRSLSGFYDVQTPDGIITCRGRGVLRKKGDTPLTGDMVEITVEHGKGMVERLLPRKKIFNTANHAIIAAVFQFISTAMMGVMPSSGGSTAALITRTSLIAWLPGQRIPSSLPL